MLFTFVVNLYRLLALSVVLMPIILNVMEPSSFVTSLLYIPAFSLFLTSLFIYFDKQLLITIQLIKTRKAQKQRLIHKVRSQLTMNKGKAYVYSSKKCLLHLLRFQACRHID